MRVYCPNCAEENDLILKLGTAFRTCTECKTILRLTETVTGDVSLTGYIVEVLDD